MQHPIVQHSCERSSCDVGLVCGLFCDVIWPLILCSSYTVANDSCKTRAPFASQQTRLSHWQRA